MRFLIALVCFADLAFAGEMGHDVRELCRSEVSGYFLQLRSDIGILEGTILRNQEMLKELKATRTLKGHEMKQYGGIGPGVSVEADERAISLKFEIDTLDEQIKDYASQTSAHEKDLAARQSALKDLDKAREGIFDYVKEKNLPEGSYPIKLQYRHSCNQYQQLCPLPIEQANRLKKLATLLKDPKSCERYADLNRHP